MSEDCELVTTDDSGNATDTGGETGISSPLVPLEAAPVEEPNLPVTNGGRNLNGTFGPGNRFAIGHETEIGRRTSEFRTLLLEAVSREDYLAVVAGLVSEARAKSRGPPSCC